MRLNFRLLLSALFISVFVSVFIFSCANGFPSTEERGALADQLAQTEGWQKVLMTTETIPIVSYRPRSKNLTDTLTIYLEGDGSPWLNKTTISSDPSPRNPIGLKLALQDNSNSAVYLARPCQYIANLENTNCKKDDWTQGRFSGKNIHAINQAITLLKAEYKAEYIQLVGYSGGGAVATIITSQRDDVVKLITVAGNLDHATWTKEHRITPLTRSLNPSDYWESLQDKFQIHFVGSEDRIVGKSIAESYLSKFPDDKKPTLKILNTFTHTCCWVEEWPKLLESINLKN